MRGLTAAWLAVVVMGAAAIVLVPLLRHQERQRRLAPDVQEPFIELTWASLEPPPAAGPIVVPLVHDASGWRVKSPAGPTAGLASDWGERLRALLADADAARRPGDAGHRPDAPQGAVSRNLHAAWAAHEAKIEARVIARMQLDGAAVDPVKAAGVIDERMALRALRDIDASMFRCGGVGALPLQPVVHVALPGRPALNAWMTLSEANLWGATWTLRTMDDQRSVWSPEASDLVADALAAMPASGLAPGAVERVEAARQALRGPSESALRFDEDELVVRLAGYASVLPETRP